MKRTKTTHRQAQKLFTNMLQGLDQHVTLHGNRQNLTVVSNVQYIRLECIVHRVHHQVSKMEGMLTSFCDNYDFLPITVSDEGNRVVISAICYLDQKNYYQHRLHLTHALTRFVNDCEHYRCLY